jgi:hypothetical protein
MFSYLRYFFVWKDAFWICFVALYTCWVEQGNKLSQLDYVEKAGNGTSSQHQHPTTSNSNEIRLPRLIDLDCLFLLSINHCRPRTFNSHGSIICRQCLLSGWSYKEFLRLLLPQHSGTYSNSLINKLVIISNLRNFTLSSGPTDNVHSKGKAIPVTGREGP